MKIGKKILFITLLPVFGFLYLFLYTVGPWWESLLD